ncbi:MAG: hypothetical protein VX527_09905 [Planctomycetota bacterium]|nr:hypothetical protein [Planctomycetota bacterium]
MSHRFVICSQDPPGENGLAPLGARGDIVKQLGTMNTAPEQLGEDVLYGPGIRLEMSPNEDPLKQMILTIVEEEIAWLVIARMAHSMKWRIIDVETGDPVDIVTEDVEE